MLLKVWFKCLIALLILLSVNTHAAFCSLRDPLVAIESLFGSGYTHRSIVASITEANREELTLHLPFTLHRSEIGKHTLYMILNDAMPEGFVQARSELSDWGLIEIAWRINLDMTLDGLYFQRCRSPLCSQDFAKRLSGLLRGKKIKQILLLLNKEGSALSPALHIPDSEQALTLIAIRSALKTLAITRVSWQNTVEQFTEL